MAYRKAHGRAAKLGAAAVIEVAPPDEQPVGVPAPPSKPVPAPERDSKGCIKPGPGAIEQARKAGLASADARRFRRLLGLIELPDDHPYKGYHRFARDHRDSHAARLAADVGGGQLSAGTLGMVSSGSLALAASLYMFDFAAKNGDVKLFTQAAQLADKSRVQLLTAHELAAREAKSRAKGVESILDAIEEAAQEE